MRSRRSCSPLLLLAAACLFGLPSCSTEDDRAGSFFPPDPDPLSEALAQRAPAAGCTPVAASARCADPLAPGVDRTCTVGARTYRIHAGKTMNACARVPLVVDIPDRGETAAQHLGSEPLCTGTRCRQGLGSGWVAESDMPTGGFIVVVPEGLAELRTSTERVAALRQIVEDVKRVASVDATKVYLSGSAGGAEVAVAAGCDNSEDWAGLALHSSRTTCARIGKATPFIAFGSRADATTFSRMRLVVDGMLSLNGCNGDPTAWRVIDETERSAVCRASKSDPSARLVSCDVPGVDLAQTLCTGWGKCEGKSGVAFCDVPADPAAAPVGAPDFLQENGTSLNTPSVAWRFFKTLW